MKTISFLFCLTVSSYTLVLSQGGTPHFKDWNLNAIATGNASGHIADLTLTNTSSVSAKSPSGPFMIPSGGQFQPYIVASLTPVDIAPGEAMTIPVDGYCTDVYRPAAPKGTTLPTPTDPTPTDFEWLTHLDRITTAATDLLQVSANTPHSLTPFSSHPQKEKEFVIQQTFWIYTSSLNGNPYGYNEFCESIQDQFSESDELSTSVSGYTDRVLQSDVSHLWKVIIDVGKKAEIPTFCTTPTSIPDANQMLVPYPKPTSFYQDVTNSITVTGTGRTTGHIANLTVTNPTAKPIIVTFGPGTDQGDAIVTIEPNEPLPFGCPMFIPSGGQYQPYILPDLSPVILDSYQTLTIPVNGFCVDIHLPPVPSGTGMPPVTDWIAPSPKDRNFIWTSTAEPEKSDREIRVAVCPTDVSLPYREAIDILSNTLPPISKPGITWGTNNSPSPINTDPDCERLFDNYVPTIPGSTIPFPVTVDVAKNPSVAVPLLIDALNRIATTYDELKDKASPHISTPFSGNPEKEREAVIQQTFWLYAATLDGKLYGKNDFSDQTHRQVEQHYPGQTFTNLPQGQQDNINSGVDDFWNTFEAVGAEAKILSVPVIIPSTPTPTIDKFWDKYNTKEAKVLD